MPKEINPYSQVYSELLSGLKASKSLRDLCKDQNIIGFEHKRNPIRSNVQAGNLPELTLMCNGNIAGNISATSSSSMFKREYEIIISTGDIRLIEVQEPIEFICSCILSNWPDMVGKLTWRDKSYVKALYFTESDNGVSDAKANRGINGWNSVITFNLDLYFTTNDLKGEI